MEGLIGDLFAGLGEPNWAAEFLSGICAKTRSDAAAVLEVDVSTRCQRLPAYVGQGPEMAQAFEQTHSSGNPWRPKDERQGPPTGAVVVPDDVLPYSLLRKTAFWSDFLKPMGVDHGGGIIGLRTPQRVVSLTLLRSARRGPYDARERAWLSELAPHWVNACRLQSRLAQASPVAHAVPDVLDRMSTATFFLDERGRCTRWNAAAEVLLRKGDLVRLRGGNLITACPGNGSAIVGSGPTALRNRDGRVVAHLALHTLPGHGSTVRAHAVVFVDPVESPQPLVLRDALAALFGLTPREAELAAKLADGFDSAEVAETMGVTVGAARTRLKSVFSKTGVDHRGALIALCRSLRAVLGDESR